MPGNRKYVPVVTTVVFGILATAAVGLRFWSRSMRKSLWWDDWLAFAGLVVGVGIAVPEIAEIFRVASNPGYFSTPEGQKSSVEGYLQAELILDILWDTSLSLTKLSALFFFYRTFPLRWLRRVYYIVGALLLLAWFLITWMPFFLCRPLDAYWRQNLDNGTVAKCPLGGSSRNATTAWTLAAGIQDVVFDFIILTLPMPALWRLQMSWRKKVFVTLIFGLGYFISIISAVRMRVLAGLHHGWSSPVDDTDRVSQAVWNYVEASLSTVVVCLPTVGPALGKIKALGLSTFRPTYPSRSASRPGWPGHASRSGRQNRRSGLGPLHGGDEEVGFRAWGMEDREGERAAGEGAPVAGGYAMMTASAGWGSTKSRANSASEGGVDKYQIAHDAGNRDKPLPDIQIRQIMR